MNIYFLKHPFFYSLIFIAIFLKMIIYHLNQLIKIRAFRNHDYITILKE